MKTRNEWCQHWQIDPSISFLNHGSFGACPTSVLKEQASLRQRMEKQLVQFLDRDLDGMWFSALKSLSNFVGASSEDCAFVSNATQGVNTVLRSLEFKAGDELVVTDHEYNACRNALDFVAERSGCKVVVVKIPFPITDSSIVVDKVVAAITDKTKLLLIDHITSPTGLVLPIQKIVDIFNERGVETLVDGAHSAGQIPLDIQAINPSYYTGNCHKWLCSPKGTAFLYVRKDLQEKIRPLSISHGANSKRIDQSRFQMEFFWTGTMDPTAFLCIPKSIKFFEEVFSGGWDALRKRNHDMALCAQKEISNALGIELPCPEDMVGSMAAFPIPDGFPSGPGSTLWDPLQDQILKECGVEVPIFPWPAPPQRLLRISAQLYNTEEDYQRLADYLKKIAF